MAQYGWHNSPDSVHGQIRYFIKGCQRILQEDLVGVYLYGALADGTFNPAHSMVELLVVADKAISPTNQYFLVVELIFIISGFPAPFAVTWLRREQLAEWQHPMPYELQYHERDRAQFKADLEKYGWRTWGQRKRVDTHLAAHIGFLQKHGLTLYGESLEAMFPPVPLAAFREALLAEYARLRDKPLDNPLYTIMDLCRIWHHFKTGAINTRVEGARWALATLPPDYHPIVEQALAAFRDDDPLPADDYAIHALVGFVGAQMEAMLQS